jgi:hypothetical protein
MKTSENILVNRVANSGLITINLEDSFPQVSFKTFDVKDFLFKELILKEKDFRAALKEHDWSAYKEHILLLYCSTDAIIPVWAYMLVSSYATPYASSIYMGNKSAYIEHHYSKVISEMDFSQYEGKRIVVKGCSDKPVPPSAYMAITKGLHPHAQSIMYGEPCSTVPIFKRPRKIVK